MFCRVLLPGICPVSWGCRIHQLQECPGYDTEQSDGEVPVMLELWGMWSTPSLLALTGLFWSEVVAPDRVLSMAQIEPNCVIVQNWIVWNRTVWLNWIAWNRKVFDNYTVYLDLNWVHMPNWIVWNRTDYLYKSGFGIK